MKRRSFLAAASAAPILGLLSAKADRMVTSTDPVFVPIVFDSGTGFSSFGTEREIKYISKDGYELYFQLQEPIFEWPIDIDLDPKIYISKLVKYGNKACCYEDYGPLRLKCKIRDKSKYIFDNMYISENINYEFFEIIYKTPVNKNSTSYVYRTLWHRAYEVKR